MSINIMKHHGKFNRTRRNGAKIKYLVTHYTGTTAPAINNCIYFAGGNRNASADYFVDDSGIYEYNDPAEGYYTWAVGDGKGRHGITNRNSIHIEVVNAGGDFSPREMEHLRKLVPYLMEKFDIPASRVVRHYDASGKHCPAGYISDSRWGWLHAEITRKEKVLGWQHSINGWWWSEEDGSFPTNEWRWIDDEWYWFKEDGYAACDQWLEIEGEWYWFKPNCAMARNECCFVGNGWFVFDNQGHMVTNPRTEDDGRVVLVCED